MAVYKKPGYVSNFLSTVNKVPQSIAGGFNFLNSIGNQLASNQNTNYLKTSSTSQAGGGTNLATNTNNANQLVSNYYPENQDYLYRDTLNATPRPTSTTSSLKSTTPDYSQYPIDGISMDQLPANVYGQGLQSLYKSTAQSAQDLAAINQQNKGDIEFQRQQVQSNLQNAPDIMDMVNKVQSQFRQGNYDINQIARNLGTTPEQVKSVLSGDYVNQLSLTPEAQQKAILPYQQKATDLSTEKERADQDLKTKAERLTVTTQQNLDDAQRQLDLTTTAYDKMGALTGQGASSGYRQGIENIKADQQRLMDRMKQTADRETADMTLMKNRIADDYGTNVMRLKQNFDDGMKDLKLKYVSTLQDLQSKTSLSDANFASELNKLFASADQDKNKLFDDYLKNYKLLHDIKMDEMGKLTSIPGTSMFINPMTREVINPQDLYQQQQGLASITTQEIGGHPVTLQSSALQSLSSIDQILQDAGLGNIRLGADATSSTRDQAQTIATMAKRYGIAFDPSNPNATAAALRAAGHQVLNVGQSMHEKGLAVDLFPNQAYIAKVKPYMEAAGWKQVNPKNDAGHFEFQGQTTQGGGNTLNSALNPLFKRYYENGTIPSAKQLSGLGLDIDTFTNLAEQGYTNIKQQEYGLKGFNITNPDVFLNIDPGTRQKLNDSIDGAQTFTNNINALINEVEDSGTQRQSRRGEGKKLDQDVTDLALRAKEIYNLGVLNGPDLSLMQKILPNPTGIMAKRQGKDAIVEQLKAARDRFQKAIDVKANNYGLSTQGQQQSQGGSDMQSKMQEWLRSKGFIQ